MICLTISLFAGNMAHLWGSKPMSLEEAKNEALFHSRLVQQANSLCRDDSHTRFKRADSRVGYMNACFSISSARCGLDDGKYDLIGGSAIVSPEGHVMAEATTEDDELIVADIDLADCVQGKVILATPILTETEAAAFTLRSSRPLTASFANALSRPRLSITVNTGGSKPTG